MAFLFSTALAQKILTLLAVLFTIRKREKIFQVFVPADRNFLAPERHLHELYFRASSAEEVAPMLAVFKARFHYPKYHEPEDIGWMGKQIFLFTPRAHNVMWREEGPGEEFCFRSCNIADLHEIQFDTPRPH